MERYKLIQYNDTYFRLECFYQSNEKEENKGYLPEFRGLDYEQEKERISLSRTKRNIKEICLSNSFEYFATITINSKNCDRFSLSECQDLLKKELKAIKRKNKDFAYIFITEKHKNGAFHFHGLVKGLNFEFKQEKEIKQALYQNENGFLSHVIFDKIGYNSFSIINDYNKCCNYILKYITKDCIRNENNQIYISSRGLKKALSYDIMPIDIDYLNFQRISKNGNKFDSLYQNDFVKYVDFDVDELSSLQLQHLLFNVKEKNNNNVLTFN